MRQDKKISILLCAHNEGKVIERTLRSLKEQKCDFHYEIIMVDNQSSDRTREIAGPYVDDICVSHIRGKVPSLQVGVRFCSGDIVATADADTIYRHDWLKHIDEGFASNSATILVYGPSCIDASQSTGGKLLSNGFAQLSLACGVVNSLGFNMAIRRQEFVAILQKIPPFAFSGWGIGTQVLRDYGRQSVVYHPRMVVPKCMRRITGVGYSRSMVRWITEWGRLALGGNLSMRENQYFGFHDDHES
jgi:glycosyltransferase involved in cell wall biosynthesis